MTTTANPQVTPERLMQMAWGYALPLIIESAIVNRVFDVLESGPKTVEEVSAETGASVRGLRATMNALVGAELLATNGGRYSLTAESAAFLVSSKQTFQGGIFKHISTQLLPRWMDLPTVTRSGAPGDGVNQESQGAGFFAQFVTDILPMSYPAAQALAAHLRLSATTQPVKALDIAAGSGVWSIALAQASPNVSVTAVDWETVLPVTRRVAQSFGVADRFTFVAGNIETANFGSNYNVATLGHILHSEGEARSRALLRKVADALAPGGTIAIAEFLVNDDRTGPLNGLIFAVNMLVATQQGDTFTFHEIESWLTEAGFTDARTLDTPGPSPLILATKK
jgi:ubiquinone/menaquinone biosynthesis C-methylase UbiE